MEKLLLLLLMVLCLSFISAQERSPKKGMVIPSWPRHLVGDFDNMNTIRWEMPKLKRTNYFRLWLVWLQMHSWFCPCYTSLFRKEKLLKFLNYNDCKAFRWPSTLTLIFSSLHFKFSSCQQGSFKMPDQGFNHRSFSSMTLSPLWHNRTI